MTNGMNFESWWNNHGKHNATSKDLNYPRVRELMKLAFEVGAEGKWEAVAAERERCARICEQSDDDGEGPDSWGWHSKDYAKAIRKEGGA